MKELLKYLLLVMMALGSVGSWAQAVGDVFTAASAGDEGAVLTTFQITGLEPPTVQVGNNNNAAISQYTVGVVVLPDGVTYEGRYYKVTRVSDWAFRLCDQLTELHLGHYVTDMGEFVFSGCSHLKKVVESALRGDVNGDSVISGADVTALYNVLLDGTTANGDADVNGDGVISGADVTALYNLLLN